MSISNVVLVIAVAVTSAVAFSIVPVSCVSPPPIEVDWDGNGVVAEDERVCRVDGVWTFCPEGVTVTKKKVAVSGDMFEVDLTYRFRVRADDAEAALAQVAASNRAAAEQTVTGRPLAWKVLRADIAESQRAAKKTRRIK